jgi:hypothetical protein
VQDPFYHKEKRRKKTGMLAADAWIDSTLYDFWQSLGRGYTNVEDFFARFRVSGFKRLFTELTSDGFSFLAIGLVLMTAGLRFHRHRALQQGRGHRRHLPRSLWQRGRAARHPLG